MGARPHTLRDSLTQPILWSGSIQEGSAQFSKDVSVFKWLLLEGKDDDGLYRSFTIPVLPDMATTLSWHTTSITTGKTWFKDVRFTIKNGGFSINTHRARDADSVSKLVATSKLLTLTIIYGIR